MNASRSITKSLIAGALGGAWGGAMVGLAEAVVVTLALAPPEEYWLFPYAVVSYGLMGMLAGVGGAILVLLLTPSRGSRDAFAIGGALAVLALGGAVARYHVIQRIFHEELATFSVVGLLVHVAVLVFVGTFAVIVMYGGRRVQAWRGGLAVSAAGLLFCIGISSAAAVVASPRGDPSVSRPQRAGAAASPNIILVILDTLRADAVGSYGAGAGATPALDAFARDGVRFEHAYAQASWTRPSIATILTSLYPSAHGLRHKMDALPDQVTTIAEALHAREYWTAGFVSNINVAPVFNFQQGYDEYTYLAPDFYFWATDSATQLAIYKGLRLARERFLRDRIYFYNYYQDAAVVTGAVSSWLGQKPPQPFFLLIHFMDPHDPYFEIPYDGRGVARVSDPAPAPSRKDELRRLYDEDIGYMDQHLGGLFARLKSTGVYDNTVIAVTADHGEEFQDHGGWWHGTTLYQEQLHVPLIIKRAHEAEPGRVESRPVRSLDIAPTLMAAAGLPIPGEFTGHDLFGAAPVPAEPLFAEEELEGNVLAAVRSGPWKIITANVDNPRGLTPVELFNLEQDPGEHHNLAASEAARTQEMLRLLAQMQAAHGGGVESAE